MASSRSPRMASASGRPRFFMRSITWHRPRRPFDNGTAVCISARRGGVLSGIVADRNGSPRVARIARVHTVDRGGALLDTAHRRGHAKPGMCKRRLMLMGFASFFSSVVNCLGQRPFRTSFRASSRPSDGLFFFFVLNLGR